MGKILRYMGWALLWAGVAGYTLYAAVTTRRARESKVVKELAITISDSTSQRRMISAGQVRQRIRKAGIPTLGAGVDTVDLRAIERAISEDGFVDRVVASVSYDGTLSITLTSHHPVLRLMVDGYDCYVTERGHIFTTPPQSSLYIPVVTGSYRPPFGHTYEGLLRNDIDRRQALLDRRTDSLERAKYPLIRERRQHRDSLRKAKYSRYKPGWFSFPTDEELEILKRNHAEKRKALMRRYTYRQRLAQARIDSLTARQEDIDRKQKKLEKNYEDFMKLLTFVEWIENDRFWGSEIVQIVVRTTSSGALELDLVPRSGDFMIHLGRLDDFESKIGRLWRFYREVLTVEGWQRFSEIDLRFDGQVVCRER